jgi:hypothetical protein
VKERAKRVAKIVLSVVALLVGLAAGANEIGGVMVNPIVTELALSFGGLLSTYGATPIHVPPALARFLGLLAAAMILLVGAHSTGKLGGPTWVFKAVGFAAILIGLAAKAPTARAAVAPDPIPSDKIRPAAL